MQKRIRGNSNTPMCEGERGKEFLMSTRGWWFQWRWWLGLGAGALHAHRECHRVSGGGEARGERERISEARFRSQELVRRVGLCGCKKT